MRVLDAGASPDVVAGLQSRRAPGPFAENKAPILRKPCSEFLLPAVIGVLFSAESAANVYP